MPCLVCMSRCRLAGVPAPKANAIRVSLRRDEVSIQDSQVYANIQTIDEDFLEEHAPEGGTLWDQVNGRFATLNTCNHAYEPTTSRGQIAGLECDEGCTIADGGLSDDPGALLQSLVDVSGNCRLSSVNLTRLWTRLDKTAFLTAVAVDRIVNHWDGFCARWRFGNNFRVQHRIATGLFQIMPWGVDQALQSKVVPPIGFHTCLQMKACLADTSCAAGKPTCNASKKSKNNASSAWCRRPLKS